MSKALPPPAIVERQKNGAFKCLPQEDNCQFLCHPSVEIEALPRMLMERLKRPFLDGGSRSSHEDYWRLRLNGYQARKNLAEQKVVELLPGSSKEALFERLIFGTEEELGKEPLLVYQKVIREGKGIYLPRLVIPGTFIDPEIYDPRGAVITFGTYINTTGVGDIGSNIQKMLEGPQGAFSLVGNLQALTKENLSSNKSSSSLAQRQKILPAQSPSLICHGSYKCHGDSFIAVEGDIAQNGNLTAKGANILLSLHGFFKSQQKTQILYWRKGRDRGYSTVAGPRPDTSSTEAQLILVTGKGILTQGADCSGGTSAFLYTDGILRALPTTLTSYWQHRWDEGKECHRFSTNQGSTFTAKGDDVFLGAQGNVHVLSGKISSQNKAFFYSGQQNVVLESAYQTSHLITVSEIVALLGVNPCFIKRSIVPFPSPRLLKPGRK